LHNKTKNTHSDKKHSDGQQKEANENMVSQKKWWFYSMTNFERCSILLTFVIVLSTVTYVIFAGGQWLELSKNNTALINTQRAMVVISEMSCQTIDNLNHSGKPAVTVSPRWTNTGNTQTVNLLIYTGPSVKSATINENINYGKESDVKPDNRFIDIKPIRAVIGPKNSGGGGTTILTLDDINEIRKDKLHITFWGVATYNDIFSKNKMHITRYCFHTNGISFTEIPNILPGSNGFKTSGNIMRNIALSLEPCATHNCMDEECNNEQ
jgi:hypothetical protein